MLKIENVVAGYGHITALKSINLEVPQGSIVSLIGANGAGKSTTMRSIMGLVKPTEGRITFEGQDITSMKTQKWALIFVTTKISKLILKKCLNVSLSLTNVVTS